MARIAAAVSEEWKASCSPGGYQASRLFNSRIRVPHSTGDRCWAFAKYLRGVVRAKSLEINGKPLTVSVQDSPERQQQKGLVGRGLQTLRSLFAGSEFVADWPTRIIAKSTKEVVFEVRALE
eukprot:3401099-Alexandrium_andersonii.AAC.1